jgi:hypothetical protein
LWLVDSFIHSLGDYQMSNISNVHTITAFDSKTSKAHDGQRLAKIGYKQTAAMTKDKITALPSVCVSVPPVTPDLVTPFLQSLMPYVVELVHGAQDGIIRKLNDDSAGSLLQITDADISMDAVLQHLAAEAAGERITKDKVIAWVEDSSMADVLRLRFAELLGVGENPTAEQAAKVELQVSGYKQMFGSLSSGKTYLAPAEARKLVRALELAQVDDALSRRFAGRLQEMITNPKDAADLMSL